MRRRLFTILTALLIAYLGLLLLLWWQQDAMVFPGAGRGDRPIDAAGVSSLELVRAGGGKFRAAEARPARPIAVCAWFVGNGEDLRSAAWMAAELAAHGLWTVAAEYPGYGRSAGSPSVASLLATAEATAAHAEHLAMQHGLPFVVGGSSIGSFPAVHVAAAGRAKKLFLRAPPTTLVAAAKQAFPWLPVAWLLRHRFDNLEPAARVRCPVWIAHGVNDVVVPLRLGKELAAAFPGPVRFCEVPGVGHNDLSLGPGTVAGRDLAVFLADR